MRTELCFLLLTTLVGLLAGVWGSPETFVAGRFHRAGAVRVYGFGAYHQDPVVPGWRHDYRTNFVVGCTDMEEAGTGVLAVGEMLERPTEQMATYPSGEELVGYFDGDGWCYPLQQPNEVPFAVACDGLDSCYVVGDDLDDVQNSNVTVQFMVHYNYSEERNDWEVVDDIQWSYEGSVLEDIDGVSGSLRITEFGGKKQFWVLGAGVLYRGSVADNGWVAVTLTSNPGGTEIYEVLDYDFDSVNLFVVTDSSNLEEDPQVIRTDEFLNASTELIRWLPAFRVSAPRYNTFHRIVVVNDTHRYVAGTWSVDRQTDYPWVFSQQRDDVPEPLGMGWYLSDSLDEVIQDIALDSQGKLYVIGSFEGTEWMYDAEYPRYKRHAYYTARWEEETQSWIQPFGGGLSHAPSCYAYSAQMSTWYFGNEEITDTYSVNGNGVWWDNDSQYREYHSANPWHTLLYHSLWHVDDSEPPIFELLQHSEIPNYVVFGGAFNGLGNTTLGSIGITNIVWSEDEWEFGPIGEGLWISDGVEYARPGRVAAVEIGSLEGEDEPYLYAAGRFSRTRRNNTAVCLSNIARVPVSAFSNGSFESAAWEDVASGCDNIIEDLQFRFGSLYVTGAFTFCGNVRVNGIAKLTFAMRKVDGKKVPTLEWSPLNSGLWGTSEIIGITMEPWRRGIVLGGAFSSAGGVAGPVVYWDTVDEKFTSLVTPCAEVDSCGSDLHFQMDDDMWVQSLRRNAAGDRLYAHVGQGVDCCEEEVVSLVYWDSTHWHQVNRHTVGNAYSRVGLGKLLQRNVTAESEGNPQLCVANIRFGEDDDSYLYASYHEGIHNFLPSHFALAEWVNTIAIPESGSTMSSFLVNSFRYLLSWL